MTHKLPHPARVRLLHGRGASHSERPGFLEASRAIAISLCLLSALYFGLQLIRGWVS